MDYLKLFFSFFGRIGRTVYRAGLGSNAMTVLTVFFVTDSIALKSGGSLYAFAFQKWLLIVAAMASVVSALSLHVRRIHDRGLSGWWGVFGLAAIGVSSWWIDRLVPVISKEPAYGLLLVSPALAALALVIFQFGIVRGSSGPNEFGPDPCKEEMTTRSCAM